MKHHKRLPILIATIIETINLDSHTMIITMEQQAVLINKMQIKRDLVKVFLISREIRIDIVKKLIMLTKTLISLQIIYLKINHNINLIPKVINK